MNYSLSKFGDFRRFKSIFKGWFSEGQKLSEKQKTSKTLFSEPEIQKFIENHRKFQKWKTNYANAQGDIIYMTVQGFGQILSLSIFFDFCSILAIFRADSTILVLFLFFFKQYLVFSIGTGTRDWYRGSSIVFELNCAFKWILAYEP